MKIKTSPFLMLVVWIAFSQSNFQKYELQKDKSIHTVARQEVKQPDHAAVQQKIRDYLVKRGMNGNVAVVKGDQTLFDEGAGFANFSEKSLNQRTTAHPIGSITKAIVATSVLQLQDKGKLSIHDPVAKYFPHFPDGSNIRLIHLLNHTSGIQPPHWHFANRSPEQLIQAIGKKPIKFQPGSKWDYRDANYVVLGRVIEKVSGLPLHEYIQKNIFNQAGMAHSGFMTNQPHTVHLSTGYFKKMNRLLAARTWNPVSLFGFADIYSTASDLCQYDQALMKGKLITKKSLSEMLTPGSSSRYGLGLYNLGYAVYSRGVIGGWEALHVYYKDDTSIAVLLNVRDKKMDIHQISKDIFKIVESQTPSPLSTGGDLLLYSAR